MVPVPLAILREFGETEAVVTCLDNAGITFSHAGDFATAHGYREVAPAIRRRLIDLHSTFVTK